MPPTMLVAVPLQKSWLGVHYWKTPSIMELPVELEYIPYQEFEDRFARLNTIARPVYPTVWPNIIMFLVFSGLFATAIVGISMTGTGLSIMSQGACFILPIIAVVWIRVRKETKAKARKKFKQRSQKLLRAWTAQDFLTHAIQWKLRLRPKSVAKRWPIGNSVHLEGGIIQPIVQQVTTITPLQQLGSTSYIRNSASEEAIRSTVVVQVEDAHGQDPRRTGALSSPLTLSSPPLPTSGSIPTVTTAPRQVADVYAALRTPPIRLATATIAPQFQSPTGSPTDPISTTTANTADTGAGTGTGTVIENPPVQSTWDSLIDLFREIYCCAFIFRERKVWMIEISIREGMLDEYALPVPSPAYCDYRLPGYEDVISRSPSSVVNTGLSPPVNNSAGLSQQPRYSGPPPEYESDSENDSENDDDNGEDDYDDDERSDRASIHSTSRSQRATGRVNMLGGGVEERGNGEYSVTTMISGITPQRPIEMAAVMTSSSLLSGPRNSLIRAGSSIAATITLTTTSTEDMEQDTTTTPLNSSSSLSTLPSSDTTVISMTHEDKEEGSITMGKEE